jgi:hypothetical protein
MKITLYPVRCLLVFLFVAILLCCNKKVTSSEYYISSTNNDVYTVNTLRPSARITVFQLGQNSCSLLAGGGSDGIAVYVNTQTAVNTSTIYTDTSISNNASIALLYKGQEQVSQNAVAPNVKVNFTKITSAYVEGNFSGNVSTVMQDTTTEIINGTFYLPLE